MIFVFRCILQIKSTSVPYSVLECNPILTVLLTINAYVFNDIWIYNRSNLYPLHIVHWSLKLIQLFLLKKRPYDLCFPFNIYQLQIEYISISYCALESIALLTIFVKNGPYDLCFPWKLINYRQNLYPFHIVYWSLKLF